MRIISGTLKGVIIRPPSWFNARPTTDRARESIFNILSHTVGIEGARVLDLFAGSGAVSLEFLSRGAETVTAVDANRKSVEFIREQCKRFNLSNATVLHNDVMKFLERTLPESFDIIFADPPYSWSGYNGMIQAILKNNLLSDNGWLIVEHLQSLNLPAEHFIESRNYGQSVFSFYCNTATDKAAK